MSRDGNQKARAGRTALFSVVLLTAALAACGSHAEPDPTANARADAAEKRARALVASMTLQEKITALHGVGDSTHLRYVPGVDRLGIPPLVITNGPAGVGPGDNPIQQPATALPAPIALAASWDRSLARSYGSLIGAEARALGANLVEGPGVDIARVPLNGRTFEGLGEDPYLTSQLAVAEIRGIQSRGVIATAKHFAGYNQETNRFSINAVIGRRALREIYLPPFEAAVRSGVGAVMCAVNGVNGTFSCESADLIRELLRGAFGFRGFVMSDFFGTHATDAAVQAGLDLEMPTGRHYADPLRRALSEGRVSLAAVNRLLVRRYATMVRLGLFGRDLTPRPLPVRQHGTFARTAAARGIVLLKNARQVLPLDTRSVRSIAVVGPYAATAHTGGGGSSHVVPLYSVDPTLGIVRRAGPAVRISYVGGPPDAAARSAANADVAVVMVGNTDEEGIDRTSLSLPGNQDALVEAVARANPRTVVVLKTGGPVLMPWAASVAAIVEAWYPGQEDGNAVASVLFGDIEPAGRLPITFPRSDVETPTSAPMRHPGVNGIARYSEGLEVGYRWYDAHHVKPLFPFGHGLSYTSFAYSRLAVPRRLSLREASLKVALSLRNTGSRRGTEVVQLYLQSPRSAGEPPKQLKQFQRVSLAPGETKRVSLTLGRRAFAAWHPRRNTWHVHAGAYRVLVGASSRDIRLAQTVRVG